MADFRGVVKDLVWQFAYRGNDHSGKWLSTGGLSRHWRVPLKRWVGTTRIMSRGAAANIPVAKPGLHAAPQLRPAISAFAGSIFGGALPALDAV